MRRPACFVTLAFLLAVACKTPPASNAPVSDWVTNRPASSETYQVEGVVLDTQHRPVSEARVEVIAPGFHGRFVTSASDGRYALNDLSGGVQLHVSKGGYFSGLHGIRPGGGEYDFTLQPIEWILPDRV